DVKFPDIDIIVSPSELLLSNKTHTYEVAEGADISITCQLTYSGRERYLNWTHPMLDNEHVQTSHYEKNNDTTDLVSRTLQIKKALFRDSGEHSCYFWKDGGIQ
ncbi:unnamed protein product, partial [Meganyctiphanes norvegica]